MAATSPPEFLKLLAHDLRWQILSLLAESDRRVQEFVALLDRPMNLVSYHLRQLRAGGLVEEHRSSADGRDLYYTLTLAHIAQRFHHAGAQLHPALACAGATAPRQQPAAVLFLCTRNSARSQMAEGLLRAHAGTRPLHVASAGTHPATVDPDALAATAALGVDISAQSSKHLDQVRDQRFDYVITVCDQARERCPTFPGAPKSLHWSVADPVVARGSEEERRVVFLTTAQELAQRVDYLLLRMDAEAAIAQL